MKNREYGKKGEEIAGKFLEKKGIKILSRNYCTKYGEIDLIGIKNKTIIFIEVKLRNNKSFGLPSEAIDYKKVQKIKNTAMVYITENDLNDKDCRFDVISILYDNIRKYYHIDWLKDQYFD